MTSYHGWTHRPKAQGGTDPIPGAGAPPEVYAYMDSYAGEEMTADDWWVPSTGWDEFMCSPDAGDGTSSSRLYPHPTDFVMYRDLDGGTDPAAGIDLYLTEMMVQFGTSTDGNPIPGDIFTIGNLIQSGGSLGNFDRHISQDAYQVIINNFDNSFSVLALRTGWTNLASDRFFAMEIGNWCSGKKMRWEVIEMQVVRLGRQGGTGTDLVYVTP